MKRYSLVQALPRFYLWAAVFLLTMMVHYSDRLAWWVLRHEKKSRYVRMGGCQRSGMCCRDLAIEIPQAWARRPKVVRLFQGWYRYVHNFQPTQIVNGNLLQFSCGHLSNENDCTIYPFRPKLCREYPATTLFGHAQLHKGCGFWFLERNQLKTFQEKLAEEGHAAERRAYLSGLKQ